MPLNLPVIRTAAEYRAYAGISEAEFRRLLRRGEVVAVRRGFYIPAQPLTPEQRHGCLAVAESRALGPGAVASHVSAGVLHELPVPRTDLARAWFSVPPPSHGRRRGRIVKVSVDLPEDEVFERDGVRLTAPARTVADLARTQPLHWGVAAADAALNRCLATPDELRSAVEAPFRHGVRRAVAAVEFADGRAQSPLESISRVQLRRAAIPDPELQFPIRLRGRVIGYADFAWPEYGVVGECDGRIKYSQLLRDGETAADAVMREKERQNLIAQAGWWIVRWDFAFAMDAEALGRRVRDAFVVGRPSILDAS